MMNRFNTSSLPSAATFFGRQTSEDDIDPPANEMGSLTSKKPPCNPTGRNQPKGKQPPTRTLSFRKLAPTLSWNKRFGGLQRSNSKTMFGRKVDDESKETHPRLRTDRSNSQSSNLKAPPPYAIEVKATSEPFETPTSNAARHFDPSQHMYVHKGCPTQQPTVAHLPSLKKPPPNSIETGRVPHTSSPFAGRYGSSVTPAGQGYGVEPPRQRLHPQMQKQHISTVVNVPEHRPQKPHRQDSRPALNKQRHYYDHQYQGQNRSEHGSKEYQTQQQQKHFYPYIQGNGSLSPTRAWHNQNAANTDTNKSTIQDDLYSKESYKNFNYSSAKKLKPPPLSSFSGASHTSRSSVQSRGSPPSRSSSRRDSASTPVMMEIYPGVSEVLRGANETTQAADCNFLTPCECLVCTSRHSCIADAAYVVCPQCESVSLVENRKLPPSTKPYGLGLGFVSENDKSVASVPGAHYMKY